MICLGSTSEHFKNSDYLKFLLKFVLIFAKYLRSIANSQKFALDKVRPVTRVSLEVNHNAQLLHLLPKPPHRLRAWLTRCHNSALQKKNSYSWAILPTPSRLVRVHNRLCSSGWQRVGQNVPSQRRATRCSKLRCAAHMHVIMQARCKKHTDTQQRHTILISCGLLRIIRLQQAAGTLLCVDMCGCMCVTIQRGRCCTCCHHVHSEQGSLHMETFSPASGPGTRRMC